MKSFSAYYSHLVWDINLLNEEVRKSLKTENKVTKILGQWARPSRMWTWGGKLFASLPLVPTPHNCQGPPWYGLEMFESDFVIWVNVAFQEQRQWNKAASVSGSGSGWCNAVLRGCTDTEKTKYERGLHAPNLESLHGPKRKAAMKRTRKGGGRGLIL